MAQARLQVPLSAACASAGIPLRLPGTALHPPCLPLTAAALLQLLAGGGQQASQRGQHLTRPRLQHIDERQAAGSVEPLCLLRQRRQQL